MHELIPSSKERYYSLVALHDPVTRGNKKHGLPRLFLVAEDHGSATGPHISNGGHQARSCMAYRVDPADDNGSQAEIEFQ